METLENTLGKIEEKHISHIQDKAQRDEATFEQVDS